MASLRSLDRVFERHKSVFKALEEFEKTGRTIVKARMNFTIDRELARRFREFCRRRRINMSEQVENSIRKSIGN